MKYIGNDTNVTVYSKYSVGGKSYTTYIMQQPIKESIFSNVANTLKTVTFQDNIEIQYSNYLFNGCRALTSVDFGGVIAEQGSGEKMFYGCTSLKSVNFNNSNFNALTSTDHMFAACTSLTTINWGNFTAQNVTSMSYMFNNCASLNTVNINNWNTSKVTEINGMFIDCHALTSIDLSNWNISNVNNVQGMFASCRSLKNIYTPRIYSRTETIDLPSIYCNASNTEDKTAYTSIEPTTFTGSVHLTKGYSITYYANGGSGTMAKQIKRSGIACKISENGFIAPENKIFIGWKTSSNIGYNPGDNYTTDSDLVLYAQWKSPTYTVTLNTNGGTINSGNITSYTPGTTTTLPTNITKEGYRFGGWYNNSNCTGIPIIAIGSTETGNKTYWAKWTPNVVTHTVTFKDGSTILTTQTVNHGGAATAPTPTKAGYVLRWDKAFNNVTTDLTVNAIWLKDTDGDGIPDIEDTDTQVAYRVEHYKQNLSQTGYDTPEIERLTGNLGTTVTARPKTYTGFSENTLAAGRVSSGTVTDDGSLTLKLYYDRNTYTITYERDGGTINEGNITSYIYGVGATLPSNVTKEGYTFGGWYNNSQLTGAAVSQVTGTDEGNKIYYASWNEQGDTPYKVLHYKQGETGYTLAETEELTAATGANVTALPKVYEGYRENAEHADRVATGTVAGDGSLELRLYYDIVTYTVTFKDGETVLNTQTVNHGTAATAPVLAKEGYVLRWDKEFNNVTTDLEVNAVWLRDTDGDGIPDIEDEDTLIEYVVKHYVQQGNTNTYKVVETEKLQGRLGEAVTATPKVYEGYVENEDIVERIPSGIITSGEELELRLFYSKAKYTVVFKDGTNEVGRQVVGYGESAVAPTLRKQGYILSWDKDFNKITSNLEVNAVWRKDPNAAKDEQTPAVLPKTGEETITLGAMIALMGVAVVCFVKYKF